MQVYILWPCMDNFTWVKINALILKVTLTRYLHRRYKKNFENAGNSLNCVHGHGDKIKFQIKNHTIFKMIMSHISTFTVQYSKYFFTHF